MIKPTVGRVVLFTPHHADRHHNDDRQSWAALICYVHSDRMVNLAAFGQNGASHSKTSVTLLQDDDAKPEHGHYCEWMPYQTGQAAKTEKLQAQLDAKA